MTPIYLLADSQLLFWRSSSGASPFLELVLRSTMRSAARSVDRSGGRSASRSARGPVEGPSLRAAYIGASNGDRPEFYDLFAAAMDRIGISDRRMIASVFTSAEHAFLASADIILLAGGDAARGWNVMVETGMRDVIVGRHAAGAVLIGVSAGAMQLGAFGVIEHDGAPPELFSALGLCPFVVFSHDERRDWAGLVSVVSMLKGRARGLAIPSGGGVVCGGGGRAQSLRPGAPRPGALRPAAYELIWVNGAIERRWLPILGGMGDRVDEHFGRGNDQGASEKG